MHEKETRFEPEGYYIKTVSISLEILKSINDESTEVSLAYLSKKLNMHRSRLFRFLATFVQAGFIEHDESTGYYRLSPWTYTIGNKYYSRTGLLDVAKPAMKRLAGQCDEAVYLAVKCDRDLLFLDMVDTTQRVAVISLVGNRYPLFQTAAGRVIQSFQSRKMPSFPSSVICDIRNKAIDSGLGEGIASVAVPVFNAKKEALGSLCFVGPEFRFTKQRIEGELIPRLAEEGKIVSSKLGYDGPYFNRA